MVRAVTCSGVGGGDIPWTVAKQCDLFAASRELPDGQWRQPRIVWTTETWSGWVEQRPTGKGSVWSRLAGIFNC